MSGDSMLAQTSAVLITIVPIFALMCTLAGWVITHVLTLRAQRLAFLSQILNSARIDASSRIRNFQQWVAEVNGRLGGLTIDLELGLLAGSAGPKKLFETRQLLLIDARSYDWLRSLEEYEILFPAFIEGRIQLLERQRTLMKAMTDYVDAFETQSAEPNALRSMARPIQQFLFDQLGLSEDLRIHLQNYCLSRITGHVVPLRIPRKFQYVQLLRDERGVYKVFGEDRSQKEGQESFSRA